MKVDAVGNNLDYSPEDRIKRLTETEGQILDLLVGDKTADEICKILKIEKNTLYAHMSNIYSTLDIHSDNHWEQKEILAKFWQNYRLNHEHK